MSKLLTNLICLASKTMCNFEWCIFRSFALFNHFLSFLLFLQFKKCAKSKANSMPRWKPSTLKNGQNRWQSKSLWNSSRKNCWILKLAILFYFNNIVKSKNEFKIIFLFKRSTWDGNSWSDESPWTWKTEKRKKTVAVTLNKKRISASEI